MTMNVIKANFNYSMKNIPIPHNNQHKRECIIKTEDVIQRMRWKFFFDSKNKNKQNNNRPKKETFGFKTLRNAPQCQELLGFENDLNYLIANLEYCENKSNFQKRLSNDIRKINSSKNIFIKADKTSNYYEIDKDSYNKLKRDTITSDYKINSTDTINEINESAARITDSLDISDRVESIALKEAYVTIKDHKPQFPDKISCRLINPTKSNIGKISKHFLTKINDKLKTKLNLKQLKNTNETIEWFNTLNNKTRLKFFQFDIENFYPSVSEKLLEDSLNFASQHTNINEIEKETIRNARKSVLINDGKIWSKKSGPWDITMGAYDGAQVTDLVGLYILHQLKTNIPEIDFGIYRDDGLGVHRRIPLTKLKGIKTKIVNLFEEMGLKITTEINTMKVNFLDVTLDLNNETYMPFRKPNDEPIYINRYSNHPRHVKENLPKAVNKRLNDLSSSEKIFNENKVEYEKALTTSGYATKLKYDKTTEPRRSKRRNRTRDVIWYTPPYSMSLKTHLGKEFLKLIDKHFPINKPLHKLFNRNTVKIGYSCMKNMGSIINNHNQKIIQMKSNTNNRKCNCREKNKPKCPIPDKCATECIVYKATVQSTNANYIGMASTSFKTRYNNHLQSFSKPEKQNSTSLAQYIWNNNLSPNPKINWEIIKECKTYAPGNKSCDLCTTEKIEILKQVNNPSNINKRNDIGNRCIHKTAYVLGVIT